MPTLRPVARFFVSPAILFSLLSIAIFPNWSPAETWTSLRGTFSVEAKMLGLWGDSVILEMNDGRRVAVNQLDLKAESRIQATKLAERLAEERMARIDELKTQSTELAAPAPNPLPEPPPAPAYNAPKADTSAAEFLDQVDAALMSGHLIVLYDALPPSYRQNVDELVKLSASSLDANTFGMVTGVLHQIGDVIVTRQRWLLSSPRIASLGPAEQEFFSGPFLNFAGLLRKAFDPAAMQLQTLQDGDFRQWLEARDQAIAPYLAQLIDELGAASLQQFSVESEENGVAIVNATTGGVSMQSAYVQVEGFWVPQSLADTWADDFEQMKQSSTQVDTASIATATLFLQPAQLVLSQLANAEDANAFHQQLEAVFAPAEAMLSTFAGSIGASLAGNQAGPAGNQAGYGDYEMDMEMDMDMEMEMEMEMDMEMDMEMEQDMGLEMRGLDFGSSPR